MSTVTADIRTPLPGRSLPGRFGQFRELVWEAAVVGGVMLANMPFLDHLEELRRRIIKSLIAIAVGTAGCMYYAADIIKFLKQPAAAQGIRLIGWDATEIFSVYFKVSLAGGICLAAPVVLWQVWRFIEPALYPHERRYAGPFLISTTICFVTGAAFGHAIVAPYLMKLQMALAEAADLIFTPSALSYLSLLTSTVVAMGAVFEMPPVVFILSRIGLVDARFLIRNLRYALLLFSVAAALITPSTDMAPMLAFMAVMTAIYAISILVAAIFGRSRKVA
jgi:sec-independent protein translocase protein TatC